MNPNLPPDQQVPFLIGAIIGAIAVGTICGLLPFFLAKSRGRMGMGIAALGCCIVGGFILGILAAGPLMILFAIIVLLVPRAETPPPYGSFPMSGQQPYQQQY